MYLCCYDQLKRQVMSSAEFWSSQEQKSVVKYTPSMNLQTIYQVLYALMAPEERASRLFLKDVLFIPY